MTAADTPHDHCPCNCDHPQPFQVADHPDVPERLRGKRVCGRCWYESKALCVMVPCTEETCG